MNATPRPSPPGAPAFEDPVCTEDELAVFFRRHDTQALRVSICRWPSSPPFLALRRWIRDERGWRRLPSGEVHVRAHELPAFLEALERYRGEVARYHAERASLPPLPSPDPGSVTGAEPR